MLQTSHNHDHGVRLDMLVSRAIAVLLLCGVYAWIGTLSHDINYSV